MHIMLIPTVSIHRPIHLLTAVASLLLLGTFLRIRTEPRHVSSKSNKLNERPVFEIEGLPLGASFVRDLHLTADADPLEWLAESLKARFQSTISSNDDGTPGYPSCALNLNRYTQVALESTPEKANSRQRERLSVISFALNLRNSEGIIPAQAVSLLEAISYLLPKNKVYVSIYENDSNDKTRRLLSDLGAALQAVGVDGLWMRSSNMRSAFDTKDRIVMLAEIRNLALAPLMPYASSDTDNGTLLFLNDVVTCTSDILELVHQQRLHNAGMAFGTDWIIVDRNVRKGEANYLDPNDSRYDPNNRLKNIVPRFYDVWVGRGISGNMIYPWEQPGGYHPMSDNETWVADAYLPENKTVHQRWLNGLAIPVYSGWGGMAAFDASLFTHEHLRFRSSVLSGWTGGSQAGALGAWGRLVSSDGYLESDCPGASECEYIARDIWHLRGRDARVVLASQTRTTYSMPDWSIASQYAPVTRREGPDYEDEDAIDWSEVSMPHRVDCVATRDAEGQRLEPWNDGNLRTQLDSLWTPGKYTAAGDTRQEDDGEPVKQLKGFIAKHDGDIQVIEDACQAMRCTAELQRVIQEHFASKR